MIYLTTTLHSLQSPNKYSHVVHIIWLSGITCFHFHFHSRFNLCSYLIISYWCNSNSCWLSCFPLSWEHSSPSLNSCPLIESSYLLKGPWLLGETSWLWKSSMNLMLNSSPSFSWSPTDSHTRSHRIMFTSFQRIMHFMIHAYSSMLKFYLVSGLILNLHHSAIRISRRYWSFTWN